MEGISAKYFSMYRYVYKDVKKITKKCSGNSGLAILLESGEGMHDLLSKQERLGLMPAQERVIAMPVIQFPSFPVLVI